MACFLFPGQGREEVAVGSGRKVPGLFTGRNGNKCGWSWSQKQPEPSGQVALERDEVLGLNSLLFSLSSKFEILQFRETVWIVAFPCLPIRFPLLLCQHGRGGVWSLGREVPGKGGQGQTILGGHLAWAVTWLLVQLPEGCKVGANSLKRSVTRLCFLSQVDLRYPSCHSSSNAWEGQEGRCCSNETLQY